MLGSVVVLVNEPKRVDLMTGAVVNVLRLARATSDVSDGEGEAGTAATYEEVVEYDLPNHQSKRESPCNISQWHGTLAVVHVEIHARADEHVGWRWLEVSSAL